ncbi:hypothetical protein SPBR_07755 [Sporothrix brasiliensis 5110]|uniref:Helix-turn-helix domain-containing protein n=1 Tax=Sporothrix brasiliensis 5110 TaxID=1398154 RepID=A0A0C2EPR1_9PEZI|nr:uncharacterized protein SPBR_07755 [Sporothrix brasiliensis 5110]KIH88254.1 hypothetical protein SPBR_07755 [Sporothrix brasiliensis 5110]
MGSAASKAARAAPPRKYPTRAAGASPTATQMQPRAPREKESDASKARQLESSAQERRPRPPWPREPDPAADPTTEAATKADDKDLHFADRLRQMGIVQPNPTFSPSSTAGPVQLPTTGSRPTGGAEVRGHDDDMLRLIARNRQQYVQSPATAPRPNTTLSVLDARRRIQDLAAADDEDMAESGREFLSALTLRDTLVLRSRGVDPAVIEKRLRLKGGVVARLGPRGLVEALHAADSAEEASKAESKR